MVGVNDLKQLSCRYLGLENFLLLFCFFFFGFFLFFKIVLFSYLLLAVLGLWCCVQAFSSCSEWGLLSRCGVRTSHRGRFSCCRAPALEHQLWSTGSVVVHGLSCSSACRIFLDQGSNLCLLPWQADSLPLSHQGKPPLIHCSLQLTVEFCPVS